MKRSGTVTNEVLGGQPCLIGPHEIILDFLLQRSLVNVYLADDHEG